MGLVGMVVGRVGKGGKRVAIRRVLAVVAALLFRDWTRREFL